MVRSRRLDRRGPVAALALLLLATAPAQSARAQSAVEARLAGHAVLPAGTLIDPPRDAPEAVRTAGKFAGPGGRRVEGIGGVPGRTGNGPEARLTGIGVPLKGQPVQGISALRAAGDGSFWALADNGFGTRANSADSLLAIHRLRPDWDRGGVARQQTLWLADPDRVMPYPITLEGTRQRLLTGADIDPEGLAVTPDGFWIGDEFGPWLLQFDRTGRLKAVFDAELPGRVLRSPDNPAVRTPARPGESTGFELARSRGFEGISISTDGRYLHAMLEGPVWTEGKPETWADGGPRLRLMEFDLEERRWTGRGLFYTLEAEGHAVAEFTWIDPDHALVVERDGGEGDVARACPEKQPGPDCFERPARFKRLYLVGRGGVADGGALRKLAHVDLLAIADPDHRARQGGGEGRFAMPFSTIEAVEPAGGGNVLVANDNNLPFSAGRHLDRADDTEFVLLHVPDLFPGGGKPGGGKP